MTRSLALCVVMVLISCLLLKGQFNDINDCDMAAVLCDNQDVIFNPEGMGDNDFADPDNDLGCLSRGENNTAWYYIEIDENAPNDLELGFTISPFGGAGEDYDFAVWGPDVDCDDLGAPIRCSYAGPTCNFCPETGLGMGTTDESEPPTGDGFVSTITVQPGEGYFIMVDNFAGTSTGFELSWTGEAADWLNCDATPPCELMLVLDDTYTHCHGDNPFDLNLVINGNSDSYTINWSGTNGGTAFLNDPTIQNPTVTIPADFEGDIVYTVEVSSPDMECIDTAEVTVIVNPSPTVSIDSLQDLCFQDDPIQLIGSPAGGTWSGSVGADGVFDPEIYGPGSHSLSYSFTTDNGCTAMVTETIVVLANPDVTLPDLGTICSNFDPFELIAMPSGGTWSPPVDGTTLDPQDLELGVNILTYSFTGDNGCTTEEELEVVLQDPVQSVILGPEFLCSDDIPVQYQGQLPGGTWGGVADPTGFIDPSALGAGVYELIYTSPPLDCSLPETLTVTINDPPIAEVLDNATICNSGLSVLDFSTLIINGDTGGTWIDQNNSGATGSFPELDFSGIAPGTYLFVYTTNSAAQGCSEQSYAVTVAVEDCGCPSVALIDLDSICRTDVLLDLDNQKITGEDGFWELIETPSGTSPLELINDSLIGSDVDTGLYRLRFTLDNSQMSCPDSAEIDVYVSADAQLELQDTLFACNTQGTGGFPSVIDLNDGILQGDTGGTWLEIDFSGAAGDPDSLDYAGVDTGFYRYVYTTADAQSPCPQESDTMIVGVLDCMCPMVSIDSVGPFCSDTFGLSLSDILINMDSLEGSWSILDTPSGMTPAEIMGDQFGGVDVNPGIYELEFRLSETVPLGCAEAWTTEIEVFPQIVLQLEDTVDVCNNPDAGEFPSSVDLNDFISIGPLGGSWTDIENSGATGGSSALNFEGVAAGTYIFSYLTDSAMAPCQDIVADLVIRVNECVCPDIGLSENTVLCSDEVDFDLTVINLSGNPGEWSLINSPSGSNPVEIVNERLIGTNVDTGVYTIQFTLDGEVPQGCDSSNTTRITVNSPPAFTLDESTVICSNSDNNNQTELNLDDFVSNSGAPGGWTDLDASGAQGVLPNLDFEGVEPGEYRFQYEVEGTFPCDDSSAILVVIVEDCLCPGIDVSDPPELCFISDMNLTYSLCDLQGAGVSGAWSVLNPSATSPMISNGCILNTDSNTEAGTYELVFYADGDFPDDCPDSLIIEVDLNEELNPGEVRGDTNLCQDGLSTIDLNLLLLNQDDGGEWAYTGVVDIDGALNAETGVLSLNELALGSYTFRYGFTGSCPSESGEIEVNLIENPEANAGEGGELNCSNDAVLLGAEAEDGLSYEWTMDGVVVGTTAQIEVNAPGEYFLTVTSDGLCTDMDQAVVTAEDGIIEELVLDISNPSCNGSMDGSIVLEQIVGGVEPYEVILNGEMVSETLFNGLSAGTYDLEVIDVNGCGFVDTVEINDPEEFSVDLGEDINLEKGDSVTLTLSVLSGVLDSADWFINGELVCSGCNEYVYNAISTASISVQAYNPEGCLSEDNIQIIVEVKRRFYIPNVFSPNFDGLNDIFYVHGVEEVERVVSFQVFNRWGAMVFSAQNIAPGIPEMGWNGTYKGEGVDPGVYVYKVEILFRDGASMNIAGDITLLR